MMALMVTNCVTTVHCSRVTVAVILYRGGGGVGGGSWRWVTHVICVASYLHTVRFVGNDHSLPVRLDV
jgi:hypothetical protein